MSNSLFTPSDPPPDEPPERDETPPPPPSQPPRPTAAGGGFTRRGLAALIAVVALLGGVVGAGVTALAGGNGGSTTTTVTSEAPSAASDSPSSTAGNGLNARTLYASTAAGVVDITSRGVTEASSTISPFGAPRQQQSTATGTGFVVDGNGNIVTAAHVVNGASSITVTFQDGTTRKATLLGKDNATDVAVLKVDPSGLTLHPLALGSSANLDVGDNVAAIGDPFTYDRSISTGIVSGLDRTISAPNGFTVAHAIQTDAALNPGNSGGPVLDSSGKVIGIVDQIATNGSTNATSSGVGFAVPIDLVRSELADLEAGKAVKHAFLGVSTSDATTSNSGALIQAVTSGGPAADAGIKAGDVVTSIGATKIEGTNDLVAAIATHRAGDKVQVTIKRGSQSKTVTVTLGTQPTQAATNG
jgi:putative serine protease PepD